MNFSSRKQQKQRQIMEEHVGYAEGSIREYLNIKRTSKDRCCTVFFCLYMLVLIMLAGLGFFYGNFTQIGTFVDSSGKQCNSLLSYSSSNYTFSCSNLLSCSPPITYAYLQKVCVPSVFSVSSNSLAMQISGYNFNFTLSTMLYANIGIVIGVMILYSLIICFQRLIYSYIFVSFFLLLGFAFYLLKTINDKIASLNYDNRLDTTFSNSQLISDQQSLQPLAYILLAAYLILFPIVLFAPYSIRLGVNLLSKMYSYFERNYTIVFFSLLAALVSYGVIFIVAFLLINFLTDGTSVTSVNSFFFLYQKVYLSHPAALALFFIGVYWLFATFGSWQQYVLASSVVQWYFEDGGKQKPVVKGMKRGWYNLGSAAFDAILMPFQWIALLIYALTKMDTEARQQYQNQHPQDCLCLNNLLYRLRGLATKFYIKVNRGAPIAGALTNNNYIQSCQLAAVTFAEHHHRFFNVGGSLTLFLNLFTILTFLTINYLSLYYTNYNVFPARVSSLGLQIVLSIGLGLAIGQSLSSIFCITVDSVLFCFLMQKRGGSEISENEIKKALEQLYSVQEEVSQVLQMYEVQSDTE